MLDQLQLDLLTAVMRIEQLRDEGFPDHPSPLASHLWQRVLSCDLPRLRSHLAAETLDSEAEFRTHYLSSEA